MYGPAMLPGVEVSCPKTIDIKQYLSTSNLSINNNVDFEKICYKKCFFM
jgi:hypothetical protein